MPVQVADNSAGVLASGVAIGATAFTLTNPGGATFPTASVAANTWFYATLFTAAGALEVVKVTDRTGNVFTCSATVSSYSIGDGVELRPTAEWAADMRVDNYTHGATAKNTPTGADEFGYVDSAASNVWKKITWTNLLAALASAFSTVFLGINAAAASCSGNAATATTAGAATTAANLSGTPALPNGTTATTQAVNDNTTKLASTAFVLAQAGAATPLIESGTGTVGSATKFSREDHVHPAQAAPVTSVNGNTGAITAAQISAAATTGYGYTPANPASYVGKDIGSNAVGSFAWGIQPSSSTATVGSTYAGVTNGIASNAGGTSFPFATGFTGSGTWRCVSEYHDGSGPSYALFQRIA